MRSVNWLKMTAACAVCVLLLMCCALAQANIAVEAQIGYENAVTYLTDMPLRVRLRNDGGDADLTVAVNLTRSRVAYDRYEYPIRLAGGAEMNLTLPINIGFKQPSYTVEVLEGNTLVASCEAKPQKTISPDTLLVGLLSDAPQSLRYLNINASSDPLTRGENWQTLALDANSFPENIELLRAFRILAVDGFDVASLSSAQQAALRQWLQEGGIVILGGGASASVAGKAFAPITGVMPGQPYQAMGVDQALVNALADGAFGFTAKDKLPGTVLLTELSGGANPVASLDGKTLIDRCQVGSGVVYTCAFSLTERPLSSWSGLAGYWQRMLLTCDRVAYQRVISDLRNYYNQNEQYVDTWLLRQIPVDNTDNVALTVGLIAGFVLLSGVGSYLILKKLDKREWMWVTVPVLSIVSAVLTVAISSGMQLNKPMAAAYAVVRVEPEGDIDTDIMMGIASANKNAMRVTVEDAQQVKPGTSDYGYYIDDEELTENIQPQLRYTYTYGDGKTLTLPKAPAWDVQTVIVKPEETAALPVSASIWWEEDGLHGEIVNASDQALTPGYVITDLGYCSVPELLPGTTHSFAILKNPDRKIDPNAVEIYEGEILNDTNSYAGLYSIMDAAVWPEKKGVSQDSSDAEGTLRRNIMEVCRNGWSSYSNFHYITFGDQLIQPAVSINGEKVARMACLTAVDVKLSYRAVSEKGLVKLTRGMVPTYSCDVGDDMIPHSSGMHMSDYAYVALRDDPVICFALGESGLQDLNGITISSAEFSCESYGGMPRVWLYRMDTAQWEELQFSSFPAAIDADLLARCLDDRGQLFVRLGMRQGSSTEEVYNPSLTLEGRVK